MDIFICWSGTASHVLAEGLRAWLPRVIQAARPFLSSEDIRKGQRWNDEVKGRLAKTNFAILCMTPENLESRWIHFEAGAVAKNSEDSHVTALLLDLRSSDLVDPLAQFQHGPPTRVEVWKLAVSVNAAIQSDRRTPEDVLKWSFDQAWPDFEKLVAEARETLRKSATPTPPPRDSSQLLEEVLVLVRDLHRERNLDLIGVPYGAGLTLSPEQRTSLYGKALRISTSRNGNLEIQTDTPLVLRETPPADPKE
jgi:hypothetical protein